MHYIITVYRATTFCPHTHTQAYLFQFFSSSTPRHSKQRILLSLIISPRNEVWITPMYTILNKFNCINKSTSWTKSKEKKISGPFVVHYGATNRFSKVKEMISTTPNAKFNECALANAVFLFIWLKFSQSSDVCVVVCWQFQLEMIVQGRLFDCAHNKISTCISSITFDHISFAVLQWFLLCFQRNSHETSMIYVLMGNWFEFLSITESQITTQYANTSLPIVTKKIISNDNDGGHDHNTNN